MRRTAVYVAGDRNVIFPAVVALRSFAHSTLGDHDLFVFSEPEALDDRERFLLEVNGIKLIDVRELLPLANRNVFDSREMREGRWPLHVLLNWAVPEYLGAAGYERVLKLDYDVLVIASLAPILHRSDGFCAMTRKTQRRCTLTVATASEAAEVLSVRGQAPVELPFSINAGVALIDTTWARKIRLFESFLNIYNMMQRNGDPVAFYEQAALALIFQHADPPFAELNPIYNCYARSEHVQLCLHGDRFPVILHYLGSEKPWLMTFDAYLRLPERFRQRYSDLPLVNNLWVKFAQALPGAADFVSVPVLAEEQLYFLARRYGARGEVPAA